MTIKALYPNVRPTLNLDFAKTKALDPRVTFTRASTGTFVGSNGLIQTAASGAARFDHNPATGESLGLLVEESRTNVVTNSTNPTWSYLNGGTGVVPVVTAVSDAAPDGTTNSVQRFQFDRGAGNTSGDYSLSFIGSTVASALYSDTLWLKSNDANSYTAILYDPNGIIGEEIVVTPTWQRFALDGSTNYKNSNHTATTNPLILFGLRNDPAGGIYAIGNTNSQTADILAWGAQIEAGAFPTSYIPTSGSTVTRAADVATLANTGSSIFPTSAFTVVNSPFGTAGGGTTVKLVGPTVKRTAVYNGDLTQTQINALAGVNDDFWRWRVLGSSFALPNFTTNGSVTVDWGDGVVETLTTAVHTFTNGGGYHDIGFRLNSGTFFKPNINNNATYGPRVIAVGPAPASMKVDANSAFYGCGASLKCV
jgi:hypothetical protein